MTNFAFFFNAAAFVWKSSLSACLQELQNLMAKQHDEELQRLRIDLEEMQQSSRKVHGQLSYLEVRWGCLHVLFLVNRVFFWMVMREWVVGCLNMREDSKRKMTLGRILVHEFYCSKGSNPGVQRRYFGFIILIQKKRFMEEVLEVTFYCWWFGNPGSHHLLSMKPFEKWWNILHINRFSWIPSINVLCTFE